MALDPRHLSQLAAIARLGSFTEAADELGLAQSALSRNMKTLEEQVGAPVLIRGRRGAVATDLGATLSQYGEIIGGAQAEADASTRSITSLKANYLRVASTRLIAENFLIGPLAAFMRARPDVTCQLQIGVIEELTEMVAVGRTDLAVGNFAVLASVDGLHLEHLVEDRMTVVARPGHPLAGTNGEPADLLAGVRWVVPWVGGRFRWQIEMSVRRIGIGVMDIACETTSVAALLAIIRESDYVAMLPRFGLAPLLKRGDFIELFPPLADQGRAIGMLTHNAKRHSPVLNGFIQILRDAARTAGVPHSDRRDA